MGMRSGTELSTEVNINKINTSVGAGGEAIGGKGKIGECSG
jgi:hypothetical protein